MLGIVFYIIYCNEAMHSDPFIQCMRMKLLLEINGFAVLETYGDYHADLNH